MHNRKLASLFAVSALALAAACSRSDAPAAPESEGPETAAHGAVAVEGEEALQAMRAQFAVVEMNADTSFLTDEERAVVNKLNQVGNLMSEIYLRQRSEMNPAWREAIAAGGNFRASMAQDFQGIGSAVAVATAAAIAGQPSSASVTYVPTKLITLSNVSD